MIAVFPQDSSHYISYTAVIKDCEVINYELYTIREIQKNQRIFKILDIK